MPESEILDEIKRVCFSQDIEQRRSILHERLIDDLFRLLRSHNYYLMRECGIAHTHVSRMGVVSTRQGRIDLLSIRQDHKIAIEFESGTRVKYASVEKLLQSDADVRIAIARGERNSPFILQENTEKIHEVMGYLQIFDRKILLIIISEGICREIAHSV